MQGWERAINTLSVRRPHPHNTNLYNNNNNNNFIETSLQDTIGK